MTDRSKLTLEDQAKSEIAELGIESLSNKELLDRFLEIVERYSIDSGARRFLRDTFRPIAWQRIHDLLAENDQFTIEVADELYPLTQLYNVTCSCILFNPDYKKFEFYSTADVEKYYRLMAQVPISGREWEGHIEFLSLLAQYRRIAQMEEF